MADNNPCSHSDYIKCVCTFEKVACEDGKHTTFLMMGCSKCGEAAPFPEENFRLITPEAREWVISELRERHQIELASGF